MRTWVAAFSLIELLVVIAILGLLAALLFPVFAQSREKARQTTCLANQKQIGLSLLMYAQDHDEHFPTSWAKGWIGDPNFFVQPYMKNTRVLLCPSKAIAVETVDALCNPTKNDPYGGYYLLPGGRDNPTGEPYLWGYGFNMGPQWTDGRGLLDDGSTDAPNPGALIPVTIGGVTIQAEVRAHPKVGKALAAVAAPALTFMEADTNEPPLQSMTLDAMRPANYTAPDGTHYDDTGSPCRMLLGAGASHHSKGNVFLYADGHVKWQIYPGSKTNFGGDPASAPDICSYWASYDGSNNPEKCKTRGF